MFNVGDKIVYPTNGVGIIDEIKIMDIGGTREEYLIIRIVADNSKIMIPRAKLEEVGIRGLISNDELNTILEILKSESSRLELSSKWSKRQREYQEIIKNGSIFDITRILKNLSEIQQQKELSYSEKKILENVKKMIISEIAHVKNIDLDQAKEMIEVLI